jgi:hypothetical protein
VKQQVRHSKLLKTRPRRCLLLLGFSGTIAEYTMLRVTPSNDSRIQRSRFLTVYSVAFALTGSLLIQNKSTPQHQVVAQFHFLFRCL